MMLKINGIEGSLIMVSSPGSTRRMSEIEHSMANGSPLGYAHWLEYDAWFFPELAFLNLAGIVDWHYQGQPMGKVSDVLMEHFMGAGMPLWLQSYAVVQPGEYWSGMRRMGHEAFQTSIVEIMIGHSYHGYRCLDLYVGLGVYGRAPKYATHILAGSMVAPRDRPERSADGW